MGAHLIDGEFQSDKYPTTPRGKVPLSVKDASAQDLLWEYASRRLSVDAEFSHDLRTALRVAGYTPQAKQHAHELPPLNADLAFILGRPNFACSGLASQYRADGAQIPNEAEAEQAFVIHKLLGFYLADPAGWRDAFSRDVDALIARRKAALANQPTT